MKSSKRLIAILAVLVLTMGLFAGCSSKDNDSDLDDTVSSTDSLHDETDNTGTNDDEVDGTSGNDEVDGSEENEATQEDMIGEVYYVSTDSLSLDLHEAESEVEDYTTLDISTLTYTGTYDDVLLDETVSYYSVSADGLVTGSLEEIDTGDFIAVTYTDDGTIEIILLEKAAEDESVVAEVTAITDSGLTVTVYESTDPDATITDYASVDMTLYSSTETTESYVLDGTEAIYLASDGILTSVTADDIFVGDMLVFFTDEYGAPSIAIYPTEGE